MSKTDSIRDKIASFNGGEFSATDLPKHANLYSALMKMEKNNEIKFVRTESTGGRPRKIFVEDRLKKERKNAAKKEKGTPMPNWCSVWPEFFAAPNFVPRHVMTINRWSECYD